MVRKLFDLPPFPAANILPLFLQPLLLNYGCALNYLGSFKNPNAQAAPQTN